MTDPQPAIAIIGAGVAGLTAARRLESCCEVTLFEKARGVGGRTSTRRAEPWAFDHGAQYFTARDEAFLAEVSAWEEAEVVGRWPEAIVDLQDGVVTPREQSRPRFVGVPGMSALCKHLAQGLRVWTQTRIERLDREDGRWGLVDTDGETHGPFDIVIVTAPPVQAAELLAPVPALQEAAAGVEMAPCWAVMLAFEEALALDYEAAKVHESPLAWIAKNSAKPERPAGEGEAWLLHASPEWSAMHVESAPEIVIAGLLAAFGQATGVTPPTPVHAAAHRWLYAMTEQPVGEACLWHEELRVGVCGDWLLGNNVEAAWQSGVAMAEAVGGDGGA